jgi:hypothetical protein
MASVFPNNLRLTFESLQTPNVSIRAYDSLNAPATMISFTLLSLFIAFFYVILADVKKGYVKPPKHFPRWSWSQVFFKPKINLPVVEPKDGSKDYAEVLARGAELVSRQ